VVSHGRYIAFQMAEVAIPRGLFADILRLIVELRAPPDPAPASTARLSSAGTKPRDRGVRMKAKSTFLAWNALPSPIWAPGSPNDDGPGLPMATHGGYISPG
jgi:hypothetical protein